MSLLILPPAQTPRRRTPPVLAEELHFDARAVGRAVEALERAAKKSPSKALSVRSELSGLGVADVR